MRVGRDIQLVACMLAMAWPAAVAHAAPPCPASLRDVACRALSSRLLEVRGFPSTAVPGGRTAFRILLPAHYDPRRARGYPMLLLLHGATGSYRSWTETGDAEAITRDASMIVVMPDSGPDGGYVDWYMGSPTERPRWETFHLGQLVPWIDKHLHTTGTRAGRAVAGLSMGGYGAMHYAARHPDLFVSATSWSGSLDTSSPAIRATIETGGVQRGVPPGAIFGLRALQEIRWRGHNPADLAANLHGLDLTIRTGNGLPGGPGGDTPDLTGVAEVEVHRESESMHRQLVANGVPHLWDDYGPGVHNNYYWKRGLRQLMPQLKKVFAAAPAPPSRFTYRSIEPRYAVYGWAVAIDRKALEFSELGDVSPSGFTVRGSGKATVATPAAWAPGQKVRLNLRAGDRRLRKTVTAGSDCRLRIALTLGPANPFQQYTAAARAYGLQTAAQLKSPTGTTVYATRVAFVDRPGPCRREA
jgi:S-formylglutathione hydrolase FrmB